MVAMLQEYISLNKYFVACMYVHLACRTLLTDGATMRREHPKHRAGWRYWKNCEFQPGEGMLDDLWPLVLVISLYNLMMLTCLWSSNRPELKPVVTEPDFTFRYVWVTIRTRKKLFNYIAITRAYDNKWKLSGCIPKNIKFWPETCGHWTILTGFCQAVIKKKKNNNSDCFGRPRSQAQHLLEYLHIFHSI